MKKKTKHRMPRYFYHITKRGNMDNIFAHGLIPGKGSPLLGEVEFPDVLWMDSRLNNLVDWISHGRFKNHVLLRIDSRGLDETKLSKSGFRILGKATWWKYQGIIPPEAISTADSISHNPVWEQL